MEKKFEILSNEKQQLDYNFKSAEYNVEILKNKLENVTEEQIMIQKLNEKQQSHLNAVRSLN